jgi:HK97 gp10 family phage protein
MQIDRFQIEGAAELDAKLARLGQEVATDIGVDAVSASARFLAERWKAIAPVDPNRKPGRKYGHLRDEISFRREGTDNPNVVAFRVTTGDAFWGYFYEFGTVKQPPRPIFRAETEGMKDELVNIQIQRLRAGIEGIA